MFILLNILERTNGTQTLTMKKRLEFRSLFFHLWFQPSETYNFLKDHAYISHPVKYFCRIKTQYGTK